MYTVRSARSEDIPEIAPWTRDTFEWGDYVADSLQEWLDNPTLHVLVAAEDSGKVGAVSVVQMLSPREGWLSAARVHPEARRQGLGTLLNNASVDWVREQGGVVARLAVETSNTAATNQVAKLGYRSTSTWVFGRQGDPQPSNVQGDKPAIAGRGDVDPAWMYWSTSDIAAAGRMLIPSGWKWRQAHVEDIDLAARERRLLTTTAGWMIFELNDDDAIDIVWIASSQSDFPRLVDSAFRYCMENRIPELVFRIPETGWTGEALRREGISVSDVAVYAKSVT